MHVSHRVIADLVDCCRRQGIDPGLLLAGVPLPLAELQARDPGRRLHWDHFAQILDNVTQAAGGSWSLEQIGFETLETAPALRVIGGLALSARHLYLHACERVARKVFQVPGGRVESLPDGRIRIEIVIPGWARDSLAFMHYSAGSFRAVPRLLGQAPAQVEADLTPRRGVFLISPPPAQSLPARALRALGAPLARLFAAFAPSGEGPTGSDLLEAIDLAYDDSELQREAQELGQRLAAHTALPHLAAELQAVLRDRFCCEHVALWTQSPAGELRLVHAVGDGAHAAVTRTLTVAGRDIGRLQADLPAAVDANTAPLFDALLPWIGLGLESCTRAATRSLAGARTATNNAAEEWRLTPRQIDVLQLLARGCTNREIARALGSSAKTVEIHVSQLLRKSGATNRTALLARLWSR